ncbi:MAG TPA: hypothetical protein VFQ82_16365 [Stellaceae bacterium]|nr:hypothetical protein [Stellaceae bacterium]
MKTLSDRIGAAAGFQLVGFRVHFVRQSPQRVAELGCPLRQAPQSNGFLSQKFDVQCHNDE